MSEAEQVPRRRRRSQRAAGPPAISAPPDPATATETPALVSQPVPAAEAAQAVKPPRAEGRKPRTKKTAAAQSSPPAGRAESDKSAEPRRKSARSGEPGQGERGWRDLAGSTPSLVGVSGALRARDVARPGPGELAAAERDLVIVRRQWQPPAGEPGGP